MQNVHFTPPQIAKMLEVNVSTIKRWVDKGFLQATITAGGHRRISKMQLAQFTKKYPSLAKESYILHRLTEKRRQPVTQQWKEYYRALLSNDSVSSERVIERAYIANHSIPDILDQIVGPTLQHIGMEWQKGIISIFEEHKMSFLIRMHLFRLSDLIAYSETKKQKTAMLACVAHEQHEIVLQMLAIIFKLHGWKVHILGINIPSIELVKAGQHIKPDLIALTKVFTKSGSLEYLNVIAQYARRHNIALLYGGSGWSKIIQERTWSGGKLIRYMPSMSALHEYLQEHS